MIQQNWCTGLTYQNTARGNKYVITMSDRFIKFTKTVPMKGQWVEKGRRTSSTNGWLIPYTGGRFTAKFFRDVCKILDILNKFTSTSYTHKHWQLER